MDKCEVTLLTSYKWHQGLADVIWSGQGPESRSHAHTKTMSKHYCRNPLGYNTSHKIIKNNEG